MIVHGHQFIDYEVFAKYVEIIFEHNSIDVFRSRAVMDSSLRFLFRISRLDVIVVDLHWIRQEVHKGRHIPEGEIQQRLVGRVYVDVMTVGGGPNRPEREADVSAWAQQPKCLAHGRGYVGNVLQDGKAGDAIEGLVGYRNALCDITDDELVSLDFRVPVIFPQGKRGYRFGVIFGD